MSALTFVMGAKGLRATAGSVLCPSALYNTRSQPIDYHKCGGPGLFPRALYRALGQKIRKLPVQQTSSGSFQHADLLAHLLATCGSFGDLYRALVLR